MPTKIGTFFYYIYVNSQIVDYFEAGRRPRKRSLLGANEHFEGKPDAKRALLDSFFLFLMIATVVVVAPLA